MSRVLSALDSPKAKKWEMILLTIVVVAVMLLVLLPITLLGDRYVFNIHDYLDSFPGMIEILRRTPNPLSPYSIMPTGNGIPVVYTAYGYTFYGIIQLLFGFLTGTIISRIFSVVAGYFCMQLLLKRLLGNHEETQGICMLVSVAYAILWTTDFRSSGFAILPLVVWSFLYFIKPQRFTWKALLVGFASFFFAFAGIGIFVIAFWFVGAIIVSIGQKRANWNLLSASLSMTLICIPVNISSFILMFSEQDTNRILFDKSEVSSVFKLFKTALIDGQYHAPAFQKPLLILVGFGGLAALVAAVVLKKQKNYRAEARLGLILGGIILLFALVCALYDSNLLAGVIGRWIPVLNGFGWGRVVHLSRVPWYVLFALVLACFVRFGSAANRYAAYFLALAQIAIILISPSSYNDLQLTAKYYVTESKSDSTLTFHEFFSEDLFAEIKEEIAYNDENVIAFGYHPSILQYNGFRTLDGYFTVHSLEWQEGFRTIIAPALDASPNYEKYYDTWGGRMYLYSEDLSFFPTRNKDVPPVPCYINMDAFTKHGGKYILSRAEINNADALGVVFMGDYTTDESPYRIFVYKNPRAMESGDAY